MQFSTKGKYVVILMLANENVFYFMYYMCSVWETIMPCFAGESQQHFAGKQELSLRIEMADCNGLSSNMISHLCILLQM
jgi:hypothetical protein